MRAVINDSAGALQRRQPAQIGDTLLGNDRLHAMLAVIDMAAHRHDSGDLPVFGDGRRHKDREPGVAFKIAATADAVHQIHPGYVRGIGVSVDVKLQPHVEGNNSQTADNFRMIGDLLRAQDNAAGEEIHIGVNLAQRIGGYCQAGGADAGDFPCFQ